MLETIKVIKSRVSVRKYLNKEVPKEILRDIVDCGRLAPSGYNRQPWIFVVVTDKKIREKIAEVATYGRFIKDAGACIAVFCEKSAETALEDACAATENMIIVAQAYGLGTCWVNSYKKSHSEEVKKILKCPEDMELITLLAVGYPGEEPKRPQKKTLEEVLRWESF